MNQETLHELMRLDSSTGHLYWRERPSRNVDISKPAGCANPRGYRRIVIKGRMHYAHRLVWLYVHGCWPKSQIDHINGVKLDNRLENLRDVSRQENGKNASRRKDSTSGHVGVYGNSLGDKWMAYIKVDGKQKHLGYYVDKQDAIDVRKAAEKQYGFHANHGRIQHDLCNDASS